MPSVRSEGALACPLNDLKLGYAAEAGALVAIVRQAENLGKPGPWAW
jgi:hypothetical protein